MKIQSEISWEQNQKKVGKSLRCVIDRKKGDYYIGRTEIDSPDVDNEVLIDAKKYYLKLGDFTNIEIKDDKKKKILYSLKSSISVSARTE